jgi:hypothetical protein
MMLGMTPATRLILAPFVLVLACGDDGPPTSGGSGSGSGSSGAADSSTGIGATSFVGTSSSDGGSTSTAGSSSGTLDGTSTGSQARPCDVCAETEICVLDYDEKVCLLCDELINPPFHVVCVAEVPEACGEALNYSRACALAMCGTPHIDSVGCGCGDDGDYICGVTMAWFQPCDYWDHEEICEPGDKCVPARDDEYQPLPYDECNRPPDEAAPLGAPCSVAGLLEDPCEPTAYCDEVDPATLMGVCRALCVGTEAMPTCTEPGESCVLFSEGQPEFGGVCRPA